MALIQCPECKCEISDKAEWCIGCGYPIKKKTKSEKTLIVPKATYKSAGGNYLRWLAIAIWICGVIAAIGLSLKYDRYGDVSGFDFGMFLAYTAGFIAAGMVPFSFAEFFDDVHTIRKTLQAIRWGVQEEQVQATVKHEVKVNEIDNRMAGERKKGASAFCMFCGAKVYFDTLPEDGMNCPNCGKKLTAKLLQACRM